MSRHSNDALLVTSGVSKQVVQSDFAAAYMKKCGWSEGDALGKDQTGITEPVQMRRRGENLGVGAEKVKAADYKPWWEDLYNSSTNKVETKIESKIKTNDNKGGKKPKDGKKPKGKKEGKGNSKSVLKMAPKQLLLMARSNKTTNTQ